MGVSSALSTSTERRPSDLHFPKLKAIKVLIAPSDTAVAPTEMSLPGGFVSFTYVAYLGLQPFHLLCIHGQVLNTSVYSP